MNTAAVVARHCVRQAAVPVAIAGGIAAVGLHGLPLIPTSAADPDAGELATGAATAAWWHLPAVTAAAACALATVRLWPTLARERPGADWVLRHCPRPWHGALAATAGALLALVVCLLPLALAAAGWIPPPAACRGLTREPLVLDSQRPALEVDAGGQPLQELRLRPLAFPIGGSFAAAEVEVTADGRALGDLPVVFAGTRQLARVPVHGATVQTIRLRLRRGDLRLVFPPDGIEAVGPPDHSRLANAALAFACYLLPTALALLLAALAAPFVALPIAMAIAGTALVLATLAELGPTGFAMAQMLRGRWLPTESLFPRCVPSLATGAVAMIFAMAARWRFVR